MLKEDKLKQIVRETIDNYYEAVRPIDSEYMLTELNESRGVIDTLDSLIDNIVNYVKTMFSDDTLLEKYYSGYNKNHQCKMYNFLISSTEFNGVDTLFMINPKFHIIIYKSDNNYSDLNRNIGETNYIAHSQPNIQTKNGEHFIVNPEFNITIVINNDNSFSETLFKSKLRHEITHCKSNLFSFINNAKKLNDKTQNQIFINGLDDEDEVNKIIKRIVYLTSQDEINARSHQLYSELDDAIKNKFLRGLKQLIEHTNIYQSTIHEMNEYINILQYNIDNKLFSKELSLKYYKAIKTPIKQLLNNLLLAKNKQISQFQKVGEKWWIDKENKLK